MIVPAKATFVIGDSSNAVYESKDVILNIGNVTQESFSFDVPDTWQGKIRYSLVLEKDNGIADRLE